MNEQQVEFATKIWEYELSHETDFRFDSPRLDIYLCDDGASFLPLESGPEVVLHRSLTTPFMVATSSPSTLKDNTVRIMTFPLAYLTEF